MARPRSNGAVDLIPQPEQVDTSTDTLTTSLTALVHEFAVAVALYSAKTVWRSSLDRPYRALLAAAEAAVSVGETLVQLGAPVEYEAQPSQHAADGHHLVEQSLYLTAGHRRCMSQPDHHMAAVTALVALAYRGFLAGDGESIAEARTAVQKLDAMGRRGR